MGNLDISPVGAAKAALSLDDAQLPNLSVWLGKVLGMLLTNIYIIIT